MYVLTRVGLKWPYSATSSAASPATCGEAWLVPAMPVRRFPAWQPAYASGLIRTPRLSVASVCLAQKDHTYDALELPQGQAEITAPALPPGPATSIDFLPQFVKY